MDPSVWGPCWAAGSGCDALLLREIFNADQACPLAVAPLRLMRHKRQRRPRHRYRSSGLQQQQQAAAVECNTDSPASQLRPLVMVQVPLSNINSPGCLNSDHSHHALGVTTALQQASAAATQPTQKQPAGHKAAQPSSSSSGSAAAGATSCGPMHAGDDVAAQKAAAQAQFLHKQQQEKGTHGPTPQAAVHSNKAATMQEEEQRMLLQGQCIDRRLLWSLLLCSVLCCVLVVAAKIPAAATLPAGVRWPVFVALLGALTQLSQSWLRPLQFRNTALEEQYASCSQSSWLLLDVLYSLAGCAGMSAAARDAGAGEPVVPAAYSGLGSYSAGESVLQQALPGALILGPQLLSLGLLLLAPRTYHLWRERLLLPAAKSAAVLGVMMFAMASQVCISNSTDASPAVQQQWWQLSGQQLLPQLQAAGSVLASGCVHALLLASLAVRVSAFVPLQLLHVAALLALGVGTSGSNAMLCAPLLLAATVWLPVWLLSRFEASARRTFLQQQQQHVLGCGSCKAVPQ